MLAISRAELWATGRLSTRWFQGLSAGKIGQLGAPGSACADTSPGTSRAAETAAAASGAISRLRRSIRCDYRQLALDRGASSRGSRLRHHHQCVGGDREPRADHLADVVAVDLERQRPARIERGHLELLDPCEGPHLTVASKSRPFRQRAPDERRDVDRTRPPQHYAREIAAVERRSLAELHWALSEVRIRLAVLHDHGHPVDPLAPGRHGPGVRAPPALPAEL